MSNISTFGTFTMARLGIYASQKAIDITGNNISNINTPGYTRQSIDQVSLNMGAADRYQSMLDTRVGSGAFVLGVDQKRDQFLDIRYREEMCSVGAMQSRQEALTEIKRVIDEVGKGDDGEGILEARFNEMIQMMENLNAQGAGKDEFDTLFRSAATNLVDTIHKYANSLDIAQRNLQTNFQQDIDQVNSTLDRIQELNVSIRKTQIYGGAALEMQDERNLLIDQLAEYIHIDVTKEKEYLGEKLYVDKLVISTADEPKRKLVDGIYVGHFSIRQVEGFDEKGNPLLDDDGNPVMVDDPICRMDYSTMIDPLGRKLADVSDMGVLSQESVDFEKNDDAPIRYDTEAEANAAIATLKSANPGRVYEVVPVEYKENEEDTEPKIGYQLKYTEFATVTDDNNTPNDTSDDTVQIASFENTAEGKKDAKKLADKLNGENEDISREYRVVRFTDDNGEEFYRVQRFTTEKYETQAAADERLKYIEENPELFPTEGMENGKKMTYAYEVKAVTVQPEEGAEDQESVTTYEVHRIGTFHGAVEFGDQELAGGFQELREVLTDQGVFSTTAELEADPAAASKRGIPFYRKALDVLANSMATVLNKANIEAYQRANPNGTDYPVLFSNDGTGNDMTGITAANISISKEWANGTFKVQITENEDSAGNTVNQSTANDNLSRILNLLQSDIRFSPQGPQYKVQTQNEDGTVTEHWATVAWDAQKGEWTETIELNADADSTDAFFTGTFQELFTNHMNGNLARDLNMTKTMLKSYETVANELYVDRDGVMGVDLNDEAMNLMMYEKSFTAACRLMTTYDTMLDKLINGTAI